MPHVLPLVVDQLVGHRHGITGVGVDAGEVIGRSDGRRRIQGTDCVGNAEGQLGCLRAHGHEDVFQRVHADGVLEAVLVGVDHVLIDGTVPADAVDDLHVHEVEVNGVGVDAVVGDPPELGFTRSHHFGGGVDVSQGQRRLDIGRGEGQFGAEDGVHAAGVIEEFVDGLVDVGGGDRVGGAVGDVGDAVILNVSNGQGSRSAIGTIVGVADRVEPGFRDDGNLLGGLEGGREVGHQVGIAGRVHPVERESSRDHVGRAGSSHRGAADSDLHDGTAVGSHAREGGTWTASVGLIGVASVGVVTRVESRNRCRGIVVQDERLPGVGSEIDEDVGPFGRSEKEGMFLNVQHDDRAAVVGIADGDVGRDPGLGQESGFVGDFNHRRTGECRIGNTAHAVIARHGGEVGRPVDAAIH